MTSRNWLLTWNNPDGDTRELLEDIYTTTKARYLVGQLEQGEEGTPHFQIWVNYPNAVRTSVFKKWKPHIHWKKGGRDNGASSYCAKEEGRLEGPFKFGEEPMRKNSATDWQKQKELAKSGEFDELDPQYMCKYFGQIK